MRVDPVTARYVEALFSLARRKGALESVRADVERIGAEMRSKKVAQFVTSPRVTPEKRLSTLQPLLDVLNPLTVKFVKLLFDKRREELLLELASAFRQRLLREAGAVEGVVESARPLDGSEINRLAESFGSKLGKRVYLENTITPELIGGFRVTVGSRMIDRSVKGRLDGLRAKMMAAPVGTAAKR